jgi:truncated hemoglobin YjbI
MRRTIFERYGGFAKVNRVVTNFYDKILDSPVTSPYFANTDMRGLSNTRPGSLLLSWVGR